MSSLLPESWALSFEPVILRLPLASHPPNHLNPGIQNVLIATNARVTIKEALRMLLKPQNNYTHYCTPDPIVAWKLRFGQTNADISPARLHIQAKTIYCTQMETSRDGSGGTSSSKARSAMKRSSALFLISLVVLLSAICKTTTTRIHAAFSWQLVAFHCSRQGNFVNSAQTGFVDPKEPSPPCSPVCPVGGEGLWLAAMTTYRARTKPQLQHAMWRNCIQNQTSQISVYRDSNCSLLKRRLRCSAPHISLMFVGTYKHGQFHLL